MDDREVGELWSVVIALGKPHYGTWGRIRELIRKLVHERDRYYGLQRYYGENPEADTLGDFGIDPETWE